VHLLAQHVNDQFSKGNDMIQKVVADMVSHFSTLARHQSAVHDQQRGLHSTLQLFVEKFGDMHAILGQHRQQLGGNCAW
jgi:hypothetical protein